MTGHTVVQAERVLGAGFVSRPGFCEVRDWFTFSIYGQQGVVDETPYLQRQGAGRSMGVQRIDITIAGPNNVCGVYGKAHANRRQQGAKRLLDECSLDAHFCVSVIELLHMT